MSVLASEILFKSILLCIFYTELLARRLDYDSLESLSSLNWVEFSSFWALEVILQIPHLVEADIYMQVLLHLLFISAFSSSRERKKKKTGEDGSEVSLRAPFLFL